MDFSNLTVLICDDEPGYRKYFKKLLELRFKTRVIEAEDPGEAFKFLEKEIPDLIIMDMQMPVMDGFSAIKLIRANPKTKGIPVIACTALSSLSLFQELVKLKISDYLVKPPSEELALKKLFKVLNDINFKKLKPETEELL